MAQINNHRSDWIALMLRVGLGLVFAIGGWSKLAQLLDPAREAAILAAYLGPAGYINQFFTEFLFEGSLGNVLTPWGFLTALSAFELVSGLALVAGWLVRPLALVYAFLLWTFVIALPVATVPGVVPEVVTYRSPALLVQIRDVGLSGMMFVLYNLGAGRLRWSLTPTPIADVNWDQLALLLRLSVAVPLIVAGVFGGLDHIQTFASAYWITLSLGLFLAAGISVRTFGALAFAVFVWYIGTKISFANSLIANLNGFKRELAFVAASAVLVLVGGGKLFVIGHKLPEWFALRRRSIQRAN